MIARGMMPPGDPRMERKMAQQGFVPGPGWNYDPMALANVQLRRGVRTLIVGMGLLMALSFVGFDHHSYTPFGPWLIPGFIVFFVGLSRVVSAYLSGGRFVVVQPPGGPVYYTPGPQAQAPQPPPQQPGAAPNVNPSGGPYGWRPGDLPEIGRGPGSIDQR